MTRLLIAKRLCDAALLSWIVMLILAVIGLSDPSRVAAFSSFAFTALAGGQIRLAMSSKGK